VLLRADAAPRDSFGATFTVNGANFLVQAFDAFGRGLTVSGSSTTRSLVQGEAAGAVYLRLTRTAKTSDALVSFTLNRTLAAPVVAPTSTPILLGTEVNDPNAGVTAPTYSFSVPADGWVAMEWQEGNWTNWQLKGPRGTEATLLSRRKISVRWAMLVAQQCGWTITSTSCAPRALAPL
jgi:hypothetical protein